MAEEPGDACYVITAAEMHPYLQVHGLNVVRASGLQPGQQAGNGKGMFPYMCCNCTFKKKKKEKSKNTFWFMLGFIIIQFVPQ